MLSLCSAAFARDPVFAPLARAVPTYLDPRTEEHTWFSDMVLFLPTVSAGGKTARASASSIAEALHAFLAQVLRGETLKLPATFERV